MSEGQVVGTISIKVTPDTSKFRRELHAELEAIEREEEAKVKVKADFDKDGLKEKVKAAAEESGATVKIKADTDLFQKRMLADLANLQRATESKIALTPDGERFRRAFDSEILSLKQNAAEKIPLDVELAAGQRAKVLADIEGLKRVAEGSAIKLKIDTEKDFQIRQRVAALSDKIAADRVAADLRANSEILRNREIFRRAQEAEAKARSDASLLKLHPEFDFKLRQALSRLPEPELPESFFSRLRGRFSGIFGGGGGGGGFGGGGSPLGGLGSIGNFGSPANLLAIFSLLPPALALAAPALASLPALIAGVVAPIGVVAVGIDGFKKAAENAGLAVAGKKGKIGVGPILKDLQDSVSDVFAKGFTPIFSQLLTVAGPAKTAMRGVAEGIVNIAQGLTNTLTSPAIINQMNTLFANIGGAISTSAPALSSFTTGLINLATQVSTHFPGLSTWFNQMGERFSSWVSKVSADGSLDKSISGLKPVLDSVVNFVGQLFDAGIKLAGDPKVMSSIKDVVDGLSSLIMESLPGLTKAFEGIANLIKDLAAGADKLEKFGDKHPGVKGPLDQIGGILQSPPDKSSPAVQHGEGFDFDHSNVKKLIDLLSSSITNPNKNGLGLIPGAGLASKGLDAFGGITDPNKNGLGLLGQGADLAGKGLDGLVNGAKNIGGDVSSAVSGAMDAAQKAISGAAGAIQSAATTAFHTIVTAAENIVGDVVSTVASIGSKIVSTVEGWGSQFFAAGAKVMQQLNDGLKSVPIVGPVISGLEGLLQHIPHSPAEKGPLSGDGWNKLFTGGQAIGNQFKDGLENGFQGVIQSATELLGQVHGALANGTIPPELKKNVTSELKAIGQEYDTLKVQRDALDPKDKSGRKAISDQMKELQTLRDQLKLGRDEFPDEKKPTAAKDMNIGQMFGQQLQKLPNIGSSFAMANVDQFEQDLGMSGKGAIPTIANIGVQWGTSLISNMIGNGFGNQGLKGGDTHIHVNSVDEAMAVKQNEQNRKAMTYAGR